MSKILKHTKMIKNKLAIFRTFLQALEDLQSVETAFSDLHRRYEKTKNVVEGFKKVSLLLTPQSVFNQIKFCHSQLCKLFLQIHQFSYK